MAKQVETEVFLRHTRSHLTACSTPELNDMLVSWRDTKGDVPDLIHEILADREAAAKEIHDLDANLLAAESVDAGQARPDVKG